jgi:polyhydroxyalkanoate synthase
MSVARFRDADEAAKVAVAAHRAPAPDELETPFSVTDRALRAAMARATAGVSPYAVAEAVWDWAAHLALSPGRQAELAIAAGTGALQNGAAWWDCLSRSHAVDPCACARTDDDRFRDPAWCSAPFNLYASTFLSIERWWEAATTGVRGVSKEHEAVTTFIARQMLDTMAPTNFLWSNPRVLERTLAEKGMNLVRGFAHWLDDVNHLRSGTVPAIYEKFRVGETVAVTPGKVIHRTPLAEIIQYAPTTDQVRPEPVVVVPAWIMKYYILDLSPENSLVRFLTGQGFTVLMISWKNPGTEDRNVGFDDYRAQGLLPAVEAATAITGGRKVHAVGYCLGGTLLAIAAAAMARDGDDRLASLTFLAAQTDFSNAGELRLFINESQVAYLEDMMWERGYLDAAQMSGAFQLLRSNDLIWSRLIREYLKGEKMMPIDIMAWNADATRMPYRMHSQYLRSLFLDNDLSEGRFAVEGRPVALHDLHLPIFAVGTERDHVAPWRSVFKFNLLADAEVTFVLTNGGHNAGIVSEPGHAHRHFRIATEAKGSTYVDPDTWLAENAEREGSWWPAWSKWLAERSHAPVPPAPMGMPDGQYAPLADAPGTYVLMK